MGIIRLWRLRVQAGWEGGLVDTIFLKFWQLRSVIKIDNEGENLEMEELELFLNF